MTEQAGGRPTRRIVVIGGGISGLAAAHRLLELKRESGQRFEPLLVEASDRLGGIVRTHRREGFLLEAGPDSFIKEKPEAESLARRIGLASHLVETNPTHRRSFIVKGGRLHPVPEGFQLLAPTRLWPFITSGIFSWRGKARMALDIFLPRRAAASAENGQSDESLAEFVRRRLGQEALERMAQPMVGGIYTADPEHLSLRATMPRFLEMERKHRSLIKGMWRAGRERNEIGSKEASGARYNLFLSFDGGMQMLTDKLASLLPETSVRLNTRVASISFDRAVEGWMIRTAAGESIACDAVCLALPAYASAALLRETDALLCAELEAIPYASSATINLGYRRQDISHPLDGFGFVVPFIEHRSILACTFSSLKFGGRAPVGQVLLRAFVGGALQPEMFLLDEDEMLLRVRRDLEELLSIKSAPLFAHIEKWPRSMAQYHVGHMERVQRIRERTKALPGLLLAGNAYTGAGIPDCVRSGEQAALEAIKRAASFSFNT